ncbi:hypothetical protein [Vibrio porteresiae]|uniref:Uncharacterized protein n=1 Tax=Vibrio porteresiae DSM 19223 TaxID=1123496 RepID=A0ABZ0Q957_9VIBR|nr:hypothetical protein [Vibrio porteresiae]WPC72307.1 hypothetical protein R8Z52_09165 [Vibrio porteresiae DSM 19223]
MNSKNWLEIMTPSLNTFIARSKESFDDFVESIFAQQPCSIHCQFPRAWLSDVDIHRLERTNVKVLSFTREGYMVKHDKLWQPIDPKLGASAQVMLTH